MDQPGGPQSGAVKHHQIARRDRAKQVAGGAYHSRDADAGGARLQHADGVIGGIREADVARRIHAQTAGRVYSGAGRRAAIARIAADPVAGYRVDEPVGVNLANVGGAVGNIEAAGGIDGDAGGARDLRRGGLSQVAGISRRAIAGHGSDQAPGGNHAHAEVEGIGNVEIADRVGRHGLRVVELGIDGQASVAAIGGGPVAGHGGNRAGGGNLAHAAVSQLGDVEVSGGVQGEAEGGIQLGARGGAAIAREAGRAIAGVSGNGTVRSDPAHAVVAAIGDVDVAELVRGHAGGSVQLRLGAARAIAAIARRSGAREGRDDSTCGDLAHYMVSGIGDIAVPKGIHRRGLRKVQLGFGRRPAVARVTVAAVAGYRGDGGALGDHADAPVQRIGHIEVPVRIHGDAGGRVQLGGAGLPGLARESGRTVAGDRVDVEFGIDHAHAAIGRLGDVHVAGGIHRNTVRLEQARSGGQASVAGIADAPVAGDGIDDAIGGDLADI